MLSLFIYILIVIDDFRSFIFIHNEDIWIFYLITEGKIFFLQ
jgi:hypothetical protein